MKYFSGPSNFPCRRTNKCVCVPRTEPITSADENFLIWWWAKQIVDRKKKTNMKASKHSFTYYCETFHTETKHNGENKIVKTFNSNSNTFNLPSKLTSRGAFYDLLNLCGKKIRQKNTFFFSFQQNHFMQITSNSLFIYFFDFSQWKRPKKIYWKKKCWNAQKNEWKEEDECKETLKFHINKNSNRHLSYIVKSPFWRAKKMALALLLGIVSKGKSYGFKCIWRLETNKKLSRTNYVPTNWTANNDVAVAVATWKYFAFCCKANKLLSWKHPSAHLWKCYKRIKGFNLKQMHNIGYIRWREHIFLATYTRGERMWSCFESSSQQVHHFSTFFPCI